MKNMIQQLLLIILLLICPRVSVPTSNSNLAGSPYCTTVNSECATRVPIVNGTLPSYDSIIDHHPNLLSSVKSFFQLSSSQREQISLQLRDEIRNVLTIEHNPEFFHFLTHTRRQLHKHPEIMYQESQTSKLISSILSALNISYSTGWGINTHQDVIPGKGGYGIVAHIGTGKGPCILLRADMDALPIYEQASSHAIQEQYVSERPGLMHACGHDAHSTMLLGAAFLLKCMESEIQGTVRLIFQPAEEGGAGGKRMVEEGVITLEPKAQHAFGMHVWPTQPSGIILSRPGPLLAASDRFQVHIQGKGGHAAMPHLTIDPITTASAIVMNLQPLISRKLSPLESGVVSVSTISSTGGDAGAFNVIPPTVTIRGTIRASDEETLLYLRDGVEQIINSTSFMYGCNFTIEWSPDFYPPTYNDPTLFEEFSKEVGGLVSSDGRLHLVEPTMGAEDFSFLARTIPSTFFLLGQGGNEIEVTNTEGNNLQTSYGLHDPRFTLDEENMAKGVELHVNLALRALKMLLEKKKN